MATKLFKIICVLIVLTIVTSSVKAQSNKVSPKLDFDNEDSENNSTLPIMPGNQDREKDSKGTNNDRVNVASNNADSGAKSRPKIHGVRVTVDTGDNHKSKESKESIEITDVGKHKKRVGIHTDITFEISANGDDENTTNSAQKDQSEDASVPIYKGRDNSHKSRKSYNPQSRWNPNFSAERRSYDYAGRSGLNHGGYYPQSPQNLPAYPLNSGNHHDSDNVYRHGEGWTSYIPLWTTERSVYEHHRPNAVQGSYSSNSWKPCYCVSADDSRHRRESQQNRQIHRASSGIIQIIDGKLEGPFSKK